MALSLGLTKISVVYSDSVFQTVLPSRSPSKSPTTSLRIEKLRKKIKKANEWIDAKIDSLIDIFIDFEGIDCEKTKGEKRKIDKLKSFIDIYRIPLKNGFQPEGNVKTNESQYPIKFTGGCSKMKKSIRNKDKKMKTKIKLFTRFIARFEKKTCQTTLMNEGGKIYGLPSIINIYKP